MSPEKRNIEQVLDTMDETRDGSGRRLPERVGTIAIVAVHAAEPHEAELEDHRGEREDFVGEHGEAVRREPFEEEAGDALPQPVDEIDERYGPAVAEVVQPALNERVDGDGLKDGDRDRDAAREPHVPTGHEIREVVDGEREDETDDRDGDEALDVALAIEASVHTEEDPTDVLHREVGARELVHGHAIPPLGGQSSACA